MHLIVKAQDHCSEEDLNVFQRLVEEGGEVCTDGLRDRINRAVALAFCYIGESIVGIAALKNPYPSYKNEVFEKSGLKGRKHEFNRELGWVFVKENHRGNKFSFKLVKKVLSKARGSNVFATSSVGNKWMHRTLYRCGFKKEGLPYHSTCSDRKLQLFLRVAAQPDIRADNSQATHLSI